MLASLARSTAPCSGDVICLAQYLVVGASKGRAFSHVVSVSITLSCRHAGPACEGWHALLLNWAVLADLRTLLLGLGRVCQRELQVEGAMTLAEPVERGISTAWLLHAPPPAASC